ncbi:MAG: divergent polysaccharide deacetylase family protein [Alphaproteobacteria bacterium]|nr:divergent polysaccharide deacetylase family protein [Alphaproteobacteria bacterium]
MKFDIAGLFKKKKSSDDDEYDDYEDDDDEETGSGDSDGDGDSEGDDYDDDDFDYDEDDEGGGLSPEKKKKMAIIGGASAAVVVIAGGLWWFMSSDSAEEEAAEASSGSNQVSLALPAKGQRVSANDTASNTMTPPKKRSGPSLNDIEDTPTSTAPRKNLNSLNDAADTPPQQPAAGVMAPAAMVAAGVATGAAPATAPQVAALTAGNNTAVKTGKMPPPSAGAGVVVPSVFVSSYAKVGKAPPGKPLAQAPIRELVEETKDGFLPVKSAAGLSSLKAYARPFDKNDQRPRIAMIVGGLGLSSAATQAAITHLPPGVTLAFDAYGRQLDKWIPAARAAGHEVLISLPMEPINYPISDPGPLAMLTTLKAATNMVRLNKVLGKGGGYVGLVTTMGSQFTTSENSLRPILLKLKERGVLLVDRGVTPSSKVGKIGGEVGLATARVNVAVDQMATPDSIDLALSELEYAARNNKSAMGIASPYPVSIDRIVAWAAKLKEKNMVLAPVSALATTQTVPEDPAPASSAPANPALTQTPK